MRDLTYADATRQWRQDTEPYWTTDWWFFFFGKYKCGSSTHSGGRTILLLLLMERFVNVELARLQLYQVPLSKTHQEVRCPDRSRVSLQRSSARTASANGTKRWSHVSRSQRKQITLPSQLKIFCSFDKCCAGSAQNYRRRYGLYILRFRLLLKILTRD